MNTEIFDYLKALSKKENFFANFLTTVCSIVVIVAGAISLISGASEMLYTIMFACASVIMIINSVRSIKRGEKSGYFFAIVALFLLAVTAVFVYALMK